MCGIVGMISRVSAGFLHSDMEVMENLLVLDTLRGLDSTGVFAVDRQRHVGIMKIASNPYHLFACNEWGKMKNKLVQSGRILIGHNRKATQGAVNSNNAHPFHENNIVLVHNGTLRGDHKKLADTEVDSHAVCHAFNEKGAEEVIPTINGAFAFVWWDMEKNKLFAIRNDERPLSLIITRDLVTIASEAWMAKELLERANKKVEEIIDLAVGMLYEFDLSGNYTCKPVKLLEPTAHTYAQGSNCDPKKGSANETACGTGATNVSPIKQIGQRSGPFDTTVSSKFPRDKRVLLKIHDYQPSERKTHIRIVGKVVEPNHPQIDFVCNMPTEGLPDSDAKSLQLAAMMEGLVTAQVSSFTNSVNGGPSIYVQHMHPSMQVQIHNGTLAQNIWNHVVASCKCKQCTAKIYDEEAPFTVVEMRSETEIAVTCADCVEDKLPMGDIKNEFNERRASAIQSGEPVSDQPERSIIHLPAGKDSPTVH